MSFPGWWASTTCFPPAEENWSGSQWSQALRSSESFQTAQYCVLSPWVPLICAGTFLSVFLHRCLGMVWWLVARILPHRTPWGIQFFCSITSTHSSPSWGWTLSFCPLKKKTCSLLQGQMWKWPWGKHSPRKVFFKAREHSSKREYSLGWQRRRGKTKQQFTSRQPGGGRDTERGHVYHTPRIYLQWSTFFN